VLVTLLLLLLLLAAAALASPRAPAPQQLDPHVHHSAKA
jgi:hypothetical protein